MRRAARAGYTLLELLTVMGILALLMGTVAASYYGLGRGARMRGAVSALRSTVSLARQQAIMKGQALELHFLDDPPPYGFYVTNTVDNYQVGQTFYLPTGIRIVGAPATMTFQPSGGSAGGGSLISTFSLAPLTGTAAEQVNVRVYHLTGLVRIQ